MSHREKVNLLVAELARHGIRRLSVVPPIYTWLWRLGVQVPPPHCQRWPGLAFMTFVCFALIFLNLTMLWRWRSAALPGWMIWVLPLTGGVLFSVLLTGAYRYAAAQLRLPAWANYPQAQPAAAGPPLSPSRWVRCDSWVRWLLGVVVMAIVAAAILGVPHQDSVEPGATSDAAWRWADPKFPGPSGPTPLG